MSGTVAIACNPAFTGPGEKQVVVGIDVIRATTTAITAVDAGRRCFPVASIEAAAALGRKLENPLLAGELGGYRPYGFHAQNSPVAMMSPDGLERPVILLSTSGTRILVDASAHHPTYVGCLRNARATAEHLAGRHERVLLAAGESRGEFREEDRLCCGRIARWLLEVGYAPRDRFVEEIVEQWGDAPDESFLDGHSAAYLTDTEQVDDLEFILAHVDDVDSAFELRAGEVVRSPAD